MHSYAYRRVQNGSAPTLQPTNSSTRLRSGSPDVMHREPDAPQKPSPRSARRPFSPGHHNEQSHPFAHALALDDKEVDTPQLDALMYHRYGFKISTLGLDIKQGILTPQVDLVSLGRVARVLLEKNAVSTELGEVAARHVVTLIENDLQVPNQYWDVKNGELRERNRGYFTFLRLKLTRSSPTMTLEGYMVHPTSSKYLRPWVVLLRSATTVAQCIREGWGPSLEDVVVKACERGFRIHLFLVRSQRDLPPWSSPQMAFQPRKHESGFVPCHLDFCAYQRTVQSLLEEPRLKSVLLRGGILNRMCSPYVRIEEILEGPSTDAIQHGLRWKGDDDDTIFVEDFVTNGEIELLCGYFYIDNSESGRIGQTRTVSFFPTPDVWERSGIHTPAWSNSAEEKFRSLVCNLKPQADPTDSTPKEVPVKNKQGWKSTLRLHQTATKKFLEYVEEGCIVFVELL